MYQLAPIEPVDYLIIGHITLDLTPDGPRLGGTVTYSALMAQALGLRVGIERNCKCVWLQQLVINTL